MLRFIRGHPGYSTFAAGLPQAGGVGSLRTRFVGNPARGAGAGKNRKHLRGQHALGIHRAGPTARCLTFSVQANHHAQPGRQILAAIDSVVVEMGK